MKPLLAIARFLERILQPRLCLELPPGLELVAPIGMIDTSIEQAAKEYADREYRGRDAESDVLRSVAYLGYIEGARRG